MRAQFRPWPSTRAIHSHRAITTRPNTISTVRMSGFSWPSWAAVTLWPRHRQRAAAVMSPMATASQTTRLTVLTAAPAYMSLTAVSTGAGAGARSGSAGWPLDGEGWYMMIPSGRSGGYICYPQPAPNKFTAIAHEHRTEEF